MENKTGMITQYVDVNLQIGNRKTSTKLLVTGLGHQKIIPGFPWFEEQNPEINWETGTITWRKEIRTLATSIEVLDEEEYLNRTQNILDEDEESIISFMDVNGKFKLVWINTKTNLAMDMAIENNLKKQEHTVEEMVPKEYHEFLNVFSEEKAARFPESKEWDHKIDMKEGFELKSFKNYNLTPEEQMNWTNSSRKFWKKAISDHHNHLWHLCSSSSKRKMESLDHVRIIVTSMTGQSKMHTPYHLYQNSWTN